MLGREIKVPEVSSSSHYRKVPVPPNFMKFGLRSQVTDDTKVSKFVVNRFRGYGVLTPSRLPFPVDLLRRLITVYALPCDTVIL